MASQAENEQEAQAIHALVEAAQLDPARSSACLALAVSYTNEVLPRAHRFLPPDEVWRGL